MSSATGLLSALIFTTLWANQADNKLEKFFLFFPEHKISHFIQTRIRYFMKLVSVGDD